MRVYLPPPPSEWRAWRCSEKRAELTTGQDIIKSQYKFAHTQQTHTYVESRWW